MTNTTTTTFTLPPPVSAGGTAATLSRWLKKPSDVVTNGESLLGLRTVTISSSPASSRKANTT